MLRGESGAAQKDKVGDFKCHRLVVLPPIVHGEGCGVVRGRQKWLEMVALVQGEGELTGLVVNKTKCRARLFAGSGGVRSSYGRNM